MNNSTSKSLIVAGVQLPTLGMGKGKLEYYVQNAYQRGVKVMLFGEYVLNHFFKELQSMPKSMVKDQTDKHIATLKSMAQEYDMIFIAPIISIKRNTYYKLIAKITPKSIAYYQQQILISYDHWNEKRFFANPMAKLKDPMNFMVDGFKISVLSGFEIHFDPFWQSIIKRKTDLVLIPTASTFGSHNRWREIIKTKAFLHGCYILRVNRLGEYNQNGDKWQFYGDSMVVNPDGEVEIMLEDTESMIIETIYKEKTIKHRKDWGFEKELRMREKLC